MKAKRLKHCTLFLVFCGVFVIHFLSPNYNFADSRWSIHTAMSIIREGNTDLNEYQKIIQRHRSYAVETIDGHLYTMFPVGVSVLAVPFVYVIDRLIGLNDAIQERIPARVEVFIASFVVALTAVFMYLIPSRSLSRGYSLLLVFVFAFCTSAWSTASRALWQHGPSMLMLAIALYIILLARQRPSLIQFLGIPLAFSYVVRPTNGISVLLLTVFVLMEYPRYFVRYGLWSLVVAVPLIAYNLATYHAILPPYYQPQRLGSNPHFVEALAGNLFSPARGLFVFSPVLVFSLCGLLLKLRHRTFGKLNCFLLATILLHWVAVSSYRVWWGGACFGPRFSSDMIPYLLWFLISFLLALPKIRSPWRVVVGALFLCSVAVSLFIHYQGATNPKTWTWNAKCNGVAVRERLWDWRDAQFLRGIR